MIFHVINTGLSNHVQMLHSNNNIVNFIEQWTRGSLLPSQSRRGYWIFSSLSVRMSWPSRVIFSSRISFQPAKYQAVFDLSYYSFTNFVQVLAGVNLGSNLSWLSPTDCQFRESTTAWRLWFEKYRIKLIDLLDSVWHWPWLTLDLKCSVSK